MQRASLVTSETVGKTSTRTMTLLSPITRNDLILSYFFLIVISCLSYLVPTQYDIFLTLFLLISIYFSSLGWDGIRDRHNSYACKLACMSFPMQVLGVPLLLCYTFSCMTFMALEEIGSGTVFVCLVTHCIGYFVDNDSFTENENRTVVVFLVAPFLVITLNLFLSAIKSTRFTIKVD